MRVVLALDLGPSSIGWCLLDTDAKKILLSNSVSITQNSGMQSKYENGSLQSAAHERTFFRGRRKMYERSHLRRERLLRVLNIMGFLPLHYQNQIDFSEHPGKFKDYGEPLIAYSKDKSGKSIFYYEQAYKEMLCEFRSRYLGIKNVPNDWTLYYLRDKALTKAISKEELAWIILSFNAKRGYYQFVGNAEAERKQNKNWADAKAAAENAVKESKGTIGSYLYHQLLQNPSFKVKGASIQTIDRVFYEDELTRILEKQKEFIPELKDNKLYMTCVKELYKNNVQQQNILSKKDFSYLFVQDILFYQRPLKSQKKLIANCPWEQYVFVRNGKEYVRPVKCIPASHPLYEEFRLWQFLSNIRILRVDLARDEDVTNEVLSDERTKFDLYSWLATKANVTQDALLRRLHLDPSQYKWNHEDKSYPCFSTKVTILNKLEKKVGFKGVLSDKEYFHFWHILYSVVDSKERVSALRKYAKQMNMNEAALLATFSDYKVDNKKYGSLSKKAIRRFLPLMRMGSLWSEQAIDGHTHDRIQKIVDGVADENISDKVREMFKSEGSISDFRGLSYSDACYLIYNRYTEVNKFEHWDSPEDIDVYISERLNQHFLRNPVVERVVIETLSLIKDLMQYLWDEQDGARIDEIHIEMARELQQNAAARKRDSKKMADNNCTNLRINFLMQHLSECGIKGVRPYSPSQKEKLKLYEEFVFANAEYQGEEEKNIKEFRQKFPKNIGEIEPKDMVTYVKWLKHGCVSPYTGRKIKLDNLFTDAYEVDHIIPRKRYYDDSLVNKVICESVVNKAKGSMLAHEFIEKQGDKSLANGLTVLNVEQYEQLVATYFVGNRKKASRLLLDDIPQGNTNRQLNDTRYITKVLLGILSNLVREEHDDNQAVSKNIVVTNGKITDKLKHDWGLNEVWNDIVYKRYIRMNELTSGKEHPFGQWVEEGQYFQTCMPLELSLDFSKKRIDHRHHALDAMVIACTTRDIVNYLSNASASDAGVRYDLRSKLCIYAKDDMGNKSLILKQPWHSYVKDVKTQLTSDDMVVSFRKNDRIVTHTTNFYTKYNEFGKKQRFRQEKGDHWAIRKSMHIDHIYGLLNLSNEKEEWVAIRVPLDKTFGEEKINTVVNDDVRRILQSHLNTTKDDKGKLHPELAFSPEGMEAMNENIVTLNGGKFHHPIYRVRIKKKKGNMFPVGQVGNKGKKYSVADKDTNMFFAIYEDKKGKRSYRTISLREAIEREKSHLDVADNEWQGKKLLFVLSPNDLVAIPKKSGQKAFSNIYRMVSCSGSNAEFVPASIAQPIVNGRDKELKKIGYVGEFSSANKEKTSEDGQSIKQVCTKIDVDSLGRLDKRH